MKIGKKDIQETMMEYVNMKGSQISYVNLNDSVFRNVDFSGGDFEFVNINGARFKNTGGASGVPASDVSFDHCTMQKSLFNYVDMFGTEFMLAPTKGAPSAPR